MKRILKKTQTTIIIVIMVIALLSPTYYGSVECVHAATLNNPTMSKGKVTWDCVYFGHFPQSSNGKGGYNNDPIKWRVLSVNDGKAFLLSDKVLELLPYDLDGENDWEHCSLRTWLNNDFLQKAFTNEEQAAIVKKTIANNNNSKYGTSGGNSTSDFVFLPSEGEMTQESYGFPPNRRDCVQRKASSTKYATRNGNYVPDYYLRTPGEDSISAARCLSEGDVELSGEYKQFEEYIRPALYVDISSAEWTSAGTVSAQPEAAFNEYTSGKKTVSFSGTVSKSEETITGYYDDDYLFRDNTTYHKDLATISLLVTMASMSKVTKTKKNRNQYIKSLLVEKLNYKCYKSKKYEVSLNNMDDTVAYSFAKKKVYGQNVMAIVIRSGGYGSEWASNARVKGETSLTMHNGFYRAANDVYKDAKEYAKKNKIERIWVCGYSRGGAVANILGKKIADNELVKPNRLYCYTFETPTTCQAASKVRGVYNTISISDLVPRLPLYEWGYSRFGTDVFLCSTMAAGYKNYKGSISDVKKTFYNLTKEKYVPGSVAEVKTILSDAHSIVGSSNRYGLLQPLFEAGAIKHLGGESNFLKKQSKKKQVEAMSRELKLYKAIGKRITKGLLQQHYPEATYAWLTKGKTKTTNKFKTLTVAAVVWDYTHLKRGENDENIQKSAIGNTTNDYKVEVYDSDNNLVASIDKGNYQSFIDSNPEIAVDVAIGVNDELVVALPDDSDFHIVIVPNSEMKIDYKIQEHGEDERAFREVSFDSIPLEEGNVLEGDAPEGTDNDASVYNLIKDDDEAITYDKDIKGDDLSSSEIEIRSKGNGYTLGSGLYPDKTEVVLTAVPVDTASFVGWFDGDTLLSNDIKYLVTTDKENVCNITAVFNDTISNSNISIGKSNYTYNGKTRKPKVSIVGCLSTLKEGEDYSLTYKNNKSVGTAKAVITGKNNYYGKAVKTFKINPKGTTIKKLYRSRKAIKITWNKQSQKMSKSRITGYQLQLATNKAFTKNKKTVNVKGYKKMSKKIKKLKANKKYYVKIRTFKTVNGVKYYSNWSKVKTVKTK